MLSLKTNAYVDDDFSRQVVSLFSATSISAALSFVLPTFILKPFDISLFDSKTVEYFAKLTLAIVEERKKSNEQYNDFLYLLLKSEEEQSKINSNFTEDGRINRKLSIDEIVGACLVCNVQCELFLMDLLVDINLSVTGFLHWWHGGRFWNSIALNCQFVSKQKELNFSPFFHQTISNALVHVLLELALNEEVQEKLAEEVASTYPTDQVTYEDVGKSTYLDAVMKEVTRRHLGLNRVFRVALDDVDFGKFKIEKGQVS